MNSSNRVLTNQLDEIVTPTETYQEILLSPLFIPVGTISLIIDGLVLHPISVMPTAVSTTHEIIWDKPSGGVIRQSFLFIPKIVFTPITFIFVWLGHSIFDL